MAMLVRRTAKTRQDYLDIFLYIGEHNVDAAERTLQAFDDAILLIADMPKCGPARPEIGLGVRSLSVGQYLILYRVGEKAIDILRVVHGARNLRSLIDPPK